MPLTPEQEWTYWDGKLTEMRHDQLKTVQDAASGWSKLHAAALGVFGTVAFAGGLTTLDQLASPLDWIAKVATIVAALAAMLATYWSAKASQDLAPAEVPAVDAISLREAYAAATTTSLHLFEKAKRASLVAIGIVLSGSIVILLASEAEPPAKPPNALAVVGGEALCGRLTKTADGALAIGETKLTRQVESFSVVSACP